MLSRRGFFAVAAGAAAGAAGVAAAAPAPTITGVDFGSVAGDNAVFVFSGPHDPVTFSGRFERMTELFKDIRGQELPPWPYPKLAANLEIAPPIGEKALPKNTPAQERRHRQLLKKCNDENPPKNETDAQYLKRLSLPCPGRLE